MMKMTKAAFVGKWAPINKKEFIRDLNALIRAVGEECAMPPKPDGWSVVLYDEHGVQIEEWGADDLGSWDSIAAAIREIGETARKLGTAEGALCRAREHLDKWLRGSIIPGEITSSEGHDYKAWEILSSTAPCHTKRREEK